MTYLTHSFLPFRYCPTNGSVESVGVDSMLELLALVKEEDTLRQCVMANYRNQEIMDAVPGAFQRGMICLSRYAQDTISNYTQQIMDRVPKMEKVSDLDIVKKWLMSTMIILFVFGGGIERNDFFLIHGVTAAWSLMEIIGYLKLEDANQAVVHFINAAIATYVIQQAPDIKIQTAKYNSDDLRFKIGKMAIDVMDEAKNEKFKDEHIYKLIQVVLECLSEEIIDESCAYYAIRKVLNPLDFTSITSV